MAKLPVWYRHRIVKRLLLPGEWWKEFGRYHLADHPDVKIAKATLRQQASTEMSVYLNSHHPGQMMATEFFKPRLGGLEIFAALTLYGPPSVEDEIISELAKKGEA